MILKIDKYQIDKYLIDKYLIIKLINLYNDYNKIQFY